MQLLDTASSFFIILHEAKMSDDEVGSESEDVAPITQTEPRGYKKHAVSVYNGFGDGAEAGDDAGAPADDGFEAVEPDPESDDDDEEGGKRVTIGFENPDGPIGCVAVAS